MRVRSYRAVVSDTTVQIWRNALHGRNQKKHYHLVFDWMVPSRKERRRRRRMQTMNEWEGWDDSGEVDATFNEPNAHMQFVADTAQRAASPVFAVPVSQRVGLDFEWLEDWREMLEVRPESCSPLPERLPFAQGDQAV